MGGLKAISHIGRKNMTIDINAIYRSTYKHYSQAKGNINKKVMLEHRADAISDVIPGPVVTEHIIE